MPQLVDIVVATQTVQTTVTPSVSVDVRTQDNLVATMFVSQSTLVLGTPGPVGRRIFDG